MKILKVYLVVILSLFVYNNAFASLSISPLKFEFNIEKSTSKKEKIKVTNTGDTPITLYSSKEDFISGDDNGTPKFVKPEDQTNPEYALSNWIKIEDSNVTLAPKESKEVYFTVNVPKTAEPGGHYAAVFFSPGTPSGAQVAVVQRLGVLILVDVPGEVKIEGNLKSFQIGNIEDKKLNENTNFTNLPITFQTVFENLGNVHLKPVGKITLIDENGEILKNVGKETLSSPAGAYLGEKMVDYLPVNDTLGNVLPKSERKFQNDWMGFGYSILNEDGTKSVKFKNLSEYYADQASERAQYLMFRQNINSRTVNKKITAKFELNYEGKDKEKKDFSESRDFYVTYKETYIGLNYYVIGFGSILVLLALIYFVVISPKQRLRKEEELKRKIMEEMKNSKE